MINKDKFSKAWKASKRPGKQRKYAAKAPLHIRGKFMSANLSKELRKKLGKRSTILHKGDVVNVMRGKWKKKSGKVTAIDRKRLKVEIEGLQVKKQDGSKSNVKFMPWILQIKELGTTDKGRSQGKAETKGEKVNAS